PPLTLQHPEALVLVEEQAHLVGEPLAVQTPSLGEGAAGEQAAEPANGRPVRILLFDRDLEVMARIGLVIGRGRDLMEQPLVQRRAADVADAGPCVVGVWRLIEGTGDVVFAKLLDGPDFAVRPGEPAEVARRGVPPPPDLALG